MNIFLNFDYDFYVNISEQGHVRFIEQKTYMSIKRITQFYNLEIEMYNCTLKNSSFIKILLHIVAKIH